jgi:hypothetical protein
VRRAWETSRASAAEHEAQAGGELLGKDHSSQREFVVEEFVDRSTPAEGGELG